jgi:hypothetical protein
MPPIYPISTDLGDTSYAVSLAGVLARRCLQELRRSTRHLGDLWNIGPGGIMGQVAAKAESRFLFRWSGLRA